MKLNAFALPALAAMFITLGNMAVQMPWLSALFAPITQQIAAATAPAAPTTHDTREVTLKAKQSLPKLLVAQGIDPNDADNIADALSDRFKLRSLKAGQKFTLALRHDADGTTLEKLVFLPDLKRRITISQDEDGTYTAEHEARKTEVRTLAYSGKVSGSLAASARREGVPRSVVAQMTKWLAYDVDFQRELQKGDSFSVLFTAEYDDAGQMIRANAPKYISLEGAKNKIRLYQYGKKMYHADGTNVVRSLLKTPVDGARVTSGFGMRMHPILGYSAMHKGTDFGASEGAPIFAAGDGVIQRASWFSNYGNYVQIKHNTTYSTAYGHLSRYARGIRPGVRVRQGQVIGYVGQTGRATGPHLHFEVLRGGVQVNPTKVASLGTDKLQGGELKKFLASIPTLQTEYAAALSRQTIRLASNLSPVPASLNER